MIDYTDYEPLCATSDLQGDYDEQTVAQACDIVRGECGWHIAPRTTETLTLDSDGGQLVALRSLHIVDITAVTDADNNPLTDWTWSDVGLLQRTGGRRWPRGKRAIKATIEHGLRKAPPALLAVIEAIASDSAATAEIPGVIASVSIDGATISYRDAPALGSVVTSCNHLLRRYTCDR